MFDQQCLIVCQGLSNTYLLGSEVLVAAVLVTETDAVVVALAVSLAAAFDADDASKAMATPATAYNLEHLQCNISVPATLVTVLELQKLFIQPFVCGSCIEH